MVHLHSDVISEVFNCYFFHYYLAEIEKKQFNISCTAAAITGKEIEIEGHTNLGMLQYKFLKSITYRTILHHVLVSLDFLEYDK